MKTKLAGVAIGVALTVGCASYHDKTQQSYLSPLKGNCDQVTSKMGEIHHHQRIYADLKSESSVDKWQQDLGMRFVLARFVGSRRIPRC